MCVCAAYAIANWSNYSAFIQEFRNWDSAWALEALYVVAFEIRVLAEKVSSKSLSFLRVSMCFLFSPEHVGNVSSNAFCVFVG